MPNTQQELDSVKQRLAIEWARLAKVRAAFEQAEAPGNEQRLKELEQREGVLLAVIKELQVAENRLSSQLAGGSSTAVLPEGGLGPVVGLLHELVLEAKGTNDLLRVTTHILRKQFAQQFRYTSSQATKFRSPGFKQKLLKVYGSQSADHPDKVWCSAVRQWVHHELAVAAHLFKFAWRAHVDEVLGFSNINDPANGLMLLKPVEEAFDVGYICFIWEGKPGTARTEGLYRIRWLGGPKVPIVGCYPWGNPSKEVLSPANRNGLLELKNEAGGQLLFSDLDGKVLEFKTAARPFRRCLVFQARYALKQALSEGRIAEEQLVEIAPNLVAASAKSANLELYWESFAFEEPEPPPQPVETHDLLSEKEPDSASEGEEESEEAQGDPVAVGGCP